MSLTTQQIMRMLTPRPGGVFETKNGKLTYIPAHEVKAELSRVFGPGNWDSTMHDVRLLWESSSESNGKEMWRACYMAACTLRVRDYDGNQVAEFTEYHAEANSNLPDRGEAHAMALTSVESYALRRAALGLGDAFGLHLYDNGSKMPLIKGSLLLTEDRKEEYEAILAERQEVTSAAAAKVQGALKQEPSGE